MTPLNLVLSCRDLRQGVGGGLARATGDLAVALAAQGHAVRVLTDASRAPLPGLPGVEVTQLSVRRGSGTFARPAPDSAEHNLAYAAAMYREVRRLDREEEPVDAVLAPLWRSEGALCVLDERFPTAVSCMTSLRTLVTLDPEHESDEARLALERAALRRSRHLHGLTESVLRQTIADFSLEPQSATVVPRGLRDRANGSAGVPPNPDQPLHVVFAGRLEYRKGVDVLLRAGALLAASDEPVRLTLVGARDDGAADRLLAELAHHEPRLREMVTALGAVPDRRFDELLADAGVVCLPSRYESHGVAVLEAFMFGRPLLTTAAGGLGEVLDAGRTALTVPPDDPVALADGLRRLARDPELRRALGAAGRIAYETRFEAGAVAERMAQLLGNLPADPDGAEATGDAVAALLMEALGLTGESAAAAAAELLADEDPVAEATRQALRSSAPRPVPSGTARTTGVVLTRNRPQDLRRTLESLAVQAEEPIDVFVLDDASEPGESRRVADICAGRAEVRLQRLAEPMGCAAGRILGAGRTRGELLLFLDDDCELLPGALTELIATLDADPGAAAVSATVCYPDGTVAHSGGRLQVRGGTAHFELIGDGRQPEALPPSGGADWLGWTAVLVRREFLEEFPLDPEMHEYFEDNEWGYRVSQARPGVLRRSREALAIHHVGVRHPPGPSPLGRRQAVELLVAATQFLRRHGLVLAPGVFQAVPELEGNELAARVLLDLVDRAGPAWVLENWLRGGLQGFLGANSLRRERERLNVEVARLGADLRDLQARHQELCDANAQLHRDHALVLERERRLFAALEAQDRALSMLARRDETLAQIEQGGWWRLRARLLPLLRFGAPARSVAARARRAVAARSD